MYLAASAVLTLMLLAWHFSIQAAAHDAAIVQVRAWLGNMHASAGHVQFRLLRGTLTIDDIRADVQGSPLHIQSLLIKGNPASITTAKPQLQHIQIQDMILNHTGLQSWQDISLQFPQSLQTIFRYAKVITLESGRIHDQKNPYFFVDIQNINISGSPENREIHGQGKLRTQEDNPDEVWLLESFVPSATAQQTGKIITQSSTINTEILWSGAWETQNLLLNIQRTDTDYDASFTAKLKQHKQKWQGDILMQSWYWQTQNIDSLVTGDIHISGLPHAWLIQSDKVLWEETSLPTHDTFIQSMTSYDLKLNSQNKHISMQRLDIEDTNIALMPTQPLLASAWTWNIPSINIQSLYISYGADDETIELPAMNGVASIQKNKLKLDISQQVDDNQFWRLLTQKDGSIYLSASHVPLLQLRNLLPIPIRNQSYTVQGKTQLALHINPNQQWQTSGKVYVSNLTFASKNQSFSAKALKLLIPSANMHGVQHASIQANDWQMQFPLTPRQAWSSSSHLEAWAKIPWGLDKIDFQNGKVLIGNQDSVWLSAANLHINNWQNDKSAKLTLHAKAGLAPLTLKVQLLQQPDKTMTWETLDLKLAHANMFFLEDWLRISALPQVGRGHISLSIQTKKEQEHIQGSIQLALHKLQLLDDEQQSNALNQMLGIAIIQPSEAIDLQASFAGEHSWDTLAARALVDAAKTSTEQFQHRDDAIKPTHKRLGSLRIQQDIRLSLNERTRLRTMIKTIKRHKTATIELIPDIGTATLTPTLHQQVLATQSAIQSFLQRRGIHRSRIYAVLPQAKHHSTHDVNAVHINLVL